MFRNPIYSSVRGAMKQFACLALLGTLVGCGDGLGEVNYLIDNVTDLAETAGAEVNDAIDRLDNETPQNNSNESPAETPQSTDEHAPGEDSPSDAPDETPAPGADLESAREMLCGQDVRLLRV